MAQAVRKVVSSVAPAVPVTEMMTQSPHIDNTIPQERTFADLCTAFAVLALATACLGLYGTMAYAVTRRTNEIGIRMALGAERRRIVWMVQRECCCWRALDWRSGWRLRGCDVEHQEFCVWDEGGRSDCDGDRDNGSSGDSGGVRSGDESVQD